MIFANPAQSSGGQKIANGSLALGPTPKDTGGSVIRLFNRMREFSNDYPCDWVCPFNEDGAPNAAWSVAQMNTLFALLPRNVNGAKVVGSCVWGIPAAIRILEETAIGDMISVATTHNLGFNHSRWPEFAALASSYGLEYWDSEANNYDRFGVGTRVDVAIDAGCSGLVLYDAWRTVDLNTGQLTDGGYALKDKFIQYHILRNVGHNTNARPYRVDEGSLVVNAPWSWKGAYTQWEIVPTGPNTVRFRHRISGNYIRAAGTTNWSNVDTVASVTDANAEFLEWKIAHAASGEVYLISSASGKKLRCRNGNKMNSSGEYDSRVNIVPSHWRGDWVRWRIFEAPEN